MGWDRHYRCYYRLSCMPGLYIFDPKYSSDQSDAMVDGAHVNVISRDMFWVESEDVIGELDRILLEKGERESHLKERIRAERNMMFRPMEPDHHDHASNAIGPNYMGDLLEEIKNMAFAFLKTLKDNRYTSMKTSTFEVGH